MKAADLDYRRRGAWGSLGAALLLSATTISCGSSETAARDGRQVEQRAGTEALFAPIDADGPGCSAAVNIDGNIVWSQAYGVASIDRNEPFTPETVVDIGSASKQFTATAVALIAIDGQVSLDDMVSDHLDGLPAWSARVTIADLVHHTSGIPDYIDLLDAEGVDLLDESNQADAVASLDGTQLEFEPGTSFSYSNSNYVLMAELVDAITGDDLAAYLEDRIFGPLDLDARMAPGSTGSEKAESYELEDEWVVVDSPWTQMGDGAVHTTPEQLALWATQYWDSELNPEWERMRAVDAADMGAGGFYGFGIMEYPRDGADGGTILTHAGGWSGFDTGFVLDPDRRTAVAVTCNTADGPVSGDIADEVLGIWTSTA